MSVSMSTRFVACLPEAWIEALEAYRAAATTAAPDDTQDPVAVLEGDTLTIRIEGVVLPTRVAGMRCAPIDEIIAAIDEASGLREARLIIDSPGGVAQGLDVLHARLMRLRDEGAVVSARVDGLCASAAYWIASAAQKISARPLSEVGGIGVYRVYYDRSEALRDAGITPVVVRSGPHKGMGLDRITSEQIDAEAQNIADLHTQFIAAVAAGRGMRLEDVAVLATGRTWVAARALSVGLVDEVAVDATVEMADNQEDQIMSERNETDAVVVAVPEVEGNEMASEAQADAPLEPEDITSAAAASERDRCSALLGAFAQDLEFAREAIARGWSVDEARAAWLEAHPDVIGERTAAARDAATSIDPIPPIPTDPVSAREAVRRDAEARGIPLSRAWAEYWRARQVITER